MKTSTNSLTGTVDAVDDSGLFVDAVLTLC